MRIYKLGTTRVDLYCVLEHLEDYLENGGCAELFEPFGIDFFDCDYDEYDLENTLENYNLPTDNVEELFELYLDFYDDMDLDDFVSMCANKFKENEIDVEAWREELEDE